MFFLLIDFVINKKKAKKSIIYCSTRCILLLYIHVNIENNLRFAQKTLIYHYKFDKNAIKIKF